MFSRLMLAALCLGQLLAGARALPVVRRVVADDWVVRGFHWNCSEDESMCVYGFSIAVEDIGSPEPQNPAFCHFVVYSDDNQSAVHSPFSGVPCEETDAYRCGASWSSTGYMILTVDNADSSRRAYFGFKDEEVNNGMMSTTHHSPAYLVYPGLAERAPKPRLRLRDDDGSDVPEEADNDGDDGDDTVAGYAVVETDDEGVRDNQNVLSGSTLISQAEDGSAVVFTNDNLGAAAGADESDDFDPAVNLGADGAELDAASDVPPQDFSSPVISNDAALDEPNPTLIDEHADGVLPDPVEGTPATLPEPISVSPTAAPQANSTAVAEAPNNSSSAFDTSVPTVPGQPVTWGLRNITRSVTYNPNAVVMDFSIDVLPGGPLSIPCNLIVPLEGDVEPMFASWFVQKCTNSGWYLSWGYNQMTDSAVATLINPERNQSAWFGWDAINSKLPDTTLASVSPGVVQTCTC